MTVGTLKNILDSVDDDVEVRLATQPNYPFEYSTDDAVLSYDEKGNEIFYIAENQQIGYLPSDAREDLYW